MIHHQPTPTTQPNRDEILLITRMRTLNKGNQALSVAWRSLLERAFPAAQLRILERRPRHLLQYTLRRLVDAADPVRAFDQIAERLAALAPGPDVAGPPHPTRIVLDESIAPPMRFVRLRQRLNLRGRLASAGWYADDYRRRLSACQRARLVVVNPAGEFFPREPAAAFYHLLDAHVARTLGCPTAIVNHTMDITDPTLRRIIPAVYRRLDLVGFRDDKSVAAFREMGGDLRNVVVTPDLALTITPPRASEVRTDVVGVAINVPEATAGGYVQQWSAVIDALLRAGCQVRLISNELPADRPFYAQLLQRFSSVRLEGAALDHDRYATLLGGYGVVVTSRMHTGILAMAAGTPVVPVEGSSFKITGLFQELGFDEPVIRPTESGWTVRVVERVLSIRPQRDLVAHTTSDKLRVVRDRIDASLVPQLQAAARPRSP